MLKLKVEWVPQSPVGPTFTRFNPELNRHTVLRPRQLEFKEAQLQLRGKLFRERGGEVYNKLFVARTSEEEHLWVSSIPKAIIEQVARESFPI